MGAVWADYAVGGAGLVEVYCREELRRWVAWNRLRDAEASRRPFEDRNPSGPRNRPRAELHMAGPKHACLPPTGGQRGGPADYFGTARPRVDSGAQEA